MNKLLVNKNGYWYNIDLTDEAIYLNIGTNDFGEVKDFEADYSEEISIPKTDNNVIIFGGADHLASAALEPYEKYECRLFVDGLPVATKGSELLIIGCDAKSFKAQILFGGVSALDAMKEINFEDGNDDILGSVTLPLFDKGTPSIQNGVTTTNYAYGELRTAFFVSANTKTKNSDLYNGIYAYDVPLIRFGNPNTGTSGVLKTIFDTIGYSLDTDVPNKTLDQLFVSLKGRKAPENKGQVITIDGSTRQGCTTPTSIIMSVSQGQMIDGGVSATSRLFSQKASGTRIALPLLHDDLRLSVSIGIPRNVGNDYVLSKSHKLSVYLNGSLVSSTTNALGGWTTQVTLTEDLTFADVKCQFDVLDGTIGGAQINYSFEYVGSSNIDYAQPGTAMKIAPNIGFKTALDFFKAFVQLFRLKVSINNETRVIEAKTMQTIINNKNYAFDYTPKIIELGSIQFHRKTYGQNNTIKFGENKEADYIDKSTIDIADRTLEMEKEIAKMPFESGVERSTGTQIEYFKRNNDELEYNESDAPHLIYEQIIVSPTSTSYSMKHHTSNDVREYYAPYLTTQCRILSAEFNITANDIINFNAFYPIYLKQANKFFVVESIADWDGKKATLNLSRIE